MPTSSEASFRSRGSPQQPSHFLLLWCRQQGIIEKGPRNAARSKKSPHRLPHCGVFDVEDTVEYVQEDVATSVDSMIGKQTSPVRIEETVQGPAHGAVAETCRLLLAPGTPRGRTGAAVEIARIGFVCSGTLSQRTNTCGKPNCR